MSMSLEPASVAAQAWEYEVHVKVEEETDIQQGHCVYIKEEPQGTSDLKLSLECDVKEEQEEEAGGQREHGKHITEKAQCSKDHRNKPSLKLVPGSSSSPWPGAVNGSSPVYLAEEADSSESLEKSTDHNVTHKSQASGKHKSLQHKITIEKFTSGSVFNEPLKQQSMNTSKAMESTPYSCDVCLKQLSSKQNLDVHKRIHTREKPYSCEVCLKQFTRKDHLKDHKRTHTGEKPYSCEICMKKLSNKRTFDEHKRTHTGEKPFSCEVCMKRFTHKTTLVVHRQRHPVPKTYSCDSCKEQFSEKNAFVAHRQTHISKNSFTCEVCMKEYTKRNSLAAHKRTHTQAYACDVCSKRFSTKQNLVAHFRTHTGDKPYSCNLCMDKLE